MSSFARLEHRTDEDPNVVAIISFLPASVSGGALFLEMEVNFHAGLMNLGMRSNVLFMCSNCKKVIFGCNCIHEAARNLFDRMSQRCSVS
ncbi:hypothetical protein M5K25_020892 [Dendrobium thyrsiflorum]|uniref:Uncharacterized protein n=1 Tax=Dendrobium thyrsiflorum TaxID=117978 RepID=A0ABD0UIG0_DENTH